MQPIPAILPPAPGGNIIFCDCKKSSPVYTNCCTNVEVDILDDDVYYNYQFHLILHTTMFLGNSLEVTDGMEEGEFEFEKTDEQTFFSMSVL